MGQPNGWYIYKGKRRDVKNVTANYTVEPHLWECGAFDNLGATGVVKVKLPPAIPGRTHTAYVLAAQYLQLTPQTLEYTKTNAGVTGTASYGVRSNVVGTSITVECVVKGTWETVRAIGTWSSVAP